MKNVGVFLKGAFLALLAALGLCLGTAALLLASGTELYINNPLLVIYCSDMNANVSIGTIPTLVIFIGGGLMSLNKHKNKYLEDMDDDI